MFVGHSVNFGLIFVGASKLQVVRHSTGFKAIVSSSAMASCVILKASSTQLRFHCLLARHPSGDIAHCSSSLSNASTYAPTRNSHALLSQRLGPQRHVPSLARTFFSWQEAFRSRVDFFVCTTIVTCVFGVRTPLISSVFVQQMYRVKDLVSTCTSHRHNKKTPWKAVFVWCEIFPNAHDEFFLGGERRLGERQANGLGPRVTCVRCVDEGA